MAFYDDPNRQAVGLVPIWTGVEEPDTVPPPPGGDDTGGGTAESFDPGDHTIDEVKAYVEANPDQRTAVLSAERRGKARTTLIDWLAASSTGSTTSGG